MRPVIATALHTENYKLADDLYYSFLAVSMNVMLHKFSPLHEYLKTSNPEVWF